MDTTVGWRSKTNLRKFNSAGDMFKVCRIVRITGTEWEENAQAEAQALWDSLEEKSVGWTASLKWLVCRRCVSYFFSVCLRVESYYRWCVYN